MKKIFFIFYFLTFTFFCGSQNLVPNPSFEDTLHCPDNGDEINYAPPWYSPTAGTPDYFNQCGVSGYVGVPFNGFGYQPAKTGVAYAAIFAYGGSNLREYIQVQLTDTLNVGSLYCVRFSINLTDLDPGTTQVAITEMGLLFSNNPVSASNTLPLPYTPQITSPTGVYLSDTANWIDVSGIYTALGGERFITIGNFKNDASTDTTILLNSAAQQAYYYIDDVSVIDCDSLSGINEYSNNSLFNLFPNPNDGSMFLQYNLTQSEKASFKLFDVTGKLVEEKILNPNDKQVQISTNLDKGIYLYQIVIDNRVVKSDKIVIIK